MSVQQTYHRVMSEQGTACADRQHPLSTVYSRPALNVSGRSPLLGRSKQWCYCSTVGIYDICVAYLGHQAVETGRHSNILVQQHCCCRACALLAWLVHLLHLSLCGSPAGQGSSISEPDEICITIHIRLAHCAIRVDMHVVTAMRC